LENQIRRSVFAVVLSTTVAAPALAGTVITSEVSAPNVAGHSIRPHRRRAAIVFHLRGCFWGSAVQYLARTSL
jgi:hypothetical protein